MKRGIPQQIPMKSRGSLENDLKSYILKKGGVNLEKWLNF
jgi:hypothetical protein